MNYNLNSVSETLFGKFLSCALMADPTAIAEHDLSKLNLKLELDGKELPLQPVFSAFERQLNNGAIVHAPTTPPPGARSQRIPEGSISDILDQLREARDTAYNVNGYVESAVSDVISSAGDTAANITSDYAREQVQDDAWQHSPGAEVNDEVTSVLSSLIEQLEGMEP